MTQTKQTKPNAQAKNPPATKPEEGANATTQTGPDAQAAATKPEPVKKQTMLSIKTTGGQKRFCRAGLVFTDEARVIAVADLSKDQLAALKAEPRLRVEEVAG